MTKAPHSAATAMIVALCLGTGVPSGLAAADPATDVNAETTADPTAEAAAEASPEAREKKAKKEKKPGRWAESGRPPGRVISDRWGFYVGGYVADFTTDAAVGSGNVLGAVIRVEDDLGLGTDDQTFRAEGFYRFNPRHGLDFGVWSLSRNGLQTIDKEIEFEGKVFGVGARIDTEWDTSWFRLAYKYSMVNTRRAEAGITAGFSTYQFSIDLAGEVNLTDPNGVVTGTEFDSLTEEIFAPVPTFGFFLTYAMRPRLLFKLKADLMDLSLGDLEGNLIDTIVGVEWYFSRHVGIGLVNNSTNIEVKDTSDNPWAIDYKQQGWVGYFTFVFGSNIDKADHQKQ